MLGERGDSQNFWDFTRETGTAKGHINPGKKAERERTEREQREAWQTDLEHLRGIYSEQNLIKLFSMEEVDALREITEYKSLIETELARETLSRLAEILARAKDVNWDHRFEGADTFLEMADRTLDNTKGGLRLDEIQKELNQNEPSTDSH